jgi:CBS domain-containing protein
MVQAQDDPLLKNRPVAGGNASTSDAIALMIPKGTAVQVVLDREVRIQKVGQAG